MTDLSFVDWDDDRYVTRNPQVRAGLTRDGVAWAFTALAAANWHPLTWLSHMLDVQWHGLSPAGHHATSLFLHGGAVLLLFLVLQRYTGRAWRSFVVAALFGVHPLRVESVAWVAERKDVLSVFFWFLALAAYLGYVRRRGAPRYLLLCAVFILGLAAKPMLVTLPCALLLLDWWPLGRFFQGEGGSFGSGSRAVALLREKIPLVLLSAASAVVTIHAQRKGGALIPSGNFPLQDRAANAIVSYASYLGDMFWPTRLAFFYPVVEISAWQVAAAAALLSSVTALVFRARHRYPFALSGWLWYLSVLLPVIGLVQVGSQSAADRYTYLPSVGIGIALVWGVSEMEKPLGRLRLAGLGAAAAALLALGLAARKQVSTWRDTETMARQGLAVTERNWMAHFLLGNVLLARGSREEGTAHLETSLRLNPIHADAWSNLGGSYAALGRFAEAERALREAVRINPNLAAARFNLGFRLLRRGDFAGANEQYEALRTLDPAAAESLRRFLAAAR